MRFFIFAALLTLFVVSDQIGTVKLDMENQIESDPMNVKGRLFNNPEKLIDELKEEQTKEEEKKTEVEEEEIDEDQVKAMEDFLNSLFREPTEEEQKQWEEELKKWEEEQKKVEEKMMEEAKKIQARIEENQPELNEMFFNFFEFTEDQKTAYKNVQKQSKDLAKKYSESKDEEEKKKIEAEIDELMKKNQETFKVEPLMEKLFKNLENPEKMEQLGAKAKTVMSKILGEEEVKSESD